MEVENRVVFNIPSLSVLAAECIRGYTGKLLRDFTKTLNNDDLVLAFQTNDIESNQNVDGFIPHVYPRFRQQCFDPKCFSLYRLRNHERFCSSWSMHQHEKEIYGEDLARQRLSGRFKARCDLDSRHPIDGVVFRINSIMLPELWAEINLSSDQIKQAYRMLHSSSYSTNDKKRPGVFRLPNVTGRIPILQHRGDKNCWASFRCIEYNRGHDHSDECVRRRNIAMRNALDKKSEFQRISGKLEARCELKSHHEDGILFRIESDVFPMLWINIIFSEEQIQNAYSMINE